LENGFVLKVCLDKEVLRKDENMKCFMVKKCVFDKFIKII